MIHCAPTMGHMDHSGYEVLEEQMWTTEASEQQLLVQTKGTIEKAIASSIDKEVGKPTSAGYEVHWITLFNNNL